MSIIAESENRLDTHCTMITSATCCCGRRMH